MARKRKTIFPINTFPRLQYFEFPLVLPLQSLANKRRPHQPLYFAGQQVAHVLFISQARSQQSAALVGSNFFGNVCP